MDGWCDNHNLILLPHLDTTSHGKSSDFNARAPRWIPSCINALRWLRWYSSAASVFWQVHELSLIRFAIFGESNTSKPRPRYHRSQRRTFMQLGIHRGLCVWVCVSLWHNFPFIIFTMDSLFWHETRDFFQTVSAEVSGRRNLNRSP